ncbi:nitrate transporter, partial [Genlisea aurea]
MEDDKKKMKKEEPKYRGFKALPFVVCNEAFEKLGTLGATSNLLVYLTTVFNMKSIAATNVSYVFNGTCNFGTLVGAFLSDTYLGRYTTLAVATLASFLGLLVLTFTAAFGSLHPVKCGANSGACGGPSGYQLAVLYTSFALLVVGASGIRSCNLAFGADQFNPKTEQGRKGIAAFFNWYYFTFTFAMMIALTVIVYIQTDVSWALGFGIPAILMLLAVVFFLIGTRLYVTVKPEGSPLTSMFQTLYVAFKKRNLKSKDAALFNHVDEDSVNSKLATSDQLRFLNKAAIMTPEDTIAADGSAADKWNLRSIQQVEELKCLINLIPIWFSGVIYYIVLGLMQTYVVFQAMQSDRHLGRGGFQIPAGTYSIFTMIGITIWIPVYDRICVPILRRFTGMRSGITLLQRMGVGLVLGLLTMVVSGLVEKERRRVALHEPTIGTVPNKGAISSMTANLLIPQLLLAGISEAFAVIGEIELFYKQFPENMRSFAGSFLFCGFAISSYLSSSVISAVEKNSDWLAEDLNKGRLDYFYYLVAGMQLANIIYFLLCAKRYNYK